MGRIVSAGYNDSYSDATWAAEADTVRMRLISPSEAEQFLDSVVTLDARPRSVWSQGHIPDAVHINWEKFYAGSNRRPLDTEALKQLLKEKGG